MMTPDDFARIGFGRRMIQIARLAWLVCLAIVILWAIWNIVPFPGAPFLATLGLMAFPWLVAMGIAIERDSYKRGYWNVRRDSGRR